jgi:hypothetical protein
MRKLRKTNKTCQIDILKMQHNELCQTTTENKNAYMTIFRQTCITNFYWAIGNINPWKWKYVKTLDWKTVYCTGKICILSSGCQCPFLECSGMPYLPSHHLQHLSIPVISRVNTTFLLTSSILLHNVQIYNNRTRQEQSYRSEKSFRSLKSFSAHFDYSSIWKLIKITELTKQKWTGKKQKNDSILTV